MKPIALPGLFWERVADVSVWYERVRLRQMSDESALTVAACVICAGIAVVIGVAIWAIA